MSGGRHETFERLFAVSYEPLLAYAVRRCACGEDAADVVADTFAIAWRRLEQVPEGEQGLYWLYATARRVLANHRRGVQRRSALYERLVDEATRVFAASTPVEDSDVPGVAAALGRLGDTDRELLLLTAWEGLTPSQLGEVVGCSSATARGRLHRARSRLRRHLDAPRDETADERSPADVRPVGGT